MADSPAWLAARRERAAALDAAVPSFKGKTGWEFTELGDFSFDQYALANGGADGEWEADFVLETPENAITLLQLDGSSGEVAGNSGEAIVLSLADAAVEHSDSSRRISARPSRSTVPTRSSRPTTSEWASGAFVYVPRGVSVEQPIVLTAVTATPGTVLHRRTLIVLEDGASAEVWEQFISADAVR